MRPKTGRSFVLAVDFVVTDASKGDSEFLKNRKALIERVINYILLLIDTHDKVGSPLCSAELCKLSTIFFCFASQRFFKGLTHCYIVIREKATIPHMKSRNKFCSKD